LARKVSLMNFLLRITATDRTPIEISCSTEQNFPISFNAFETDFTVSRRHKYSLTEYTISFIPSAEICLDSVALLLSFGKNRIGGEFPLYMFNNQLSTNAFAKIEQIGANSGPIRSREIVTVHSDKGDLNAAFTTFERFYTEFVTDHSDLKAVWHLENKRVCPGIEYVLEKIALDDSLGGLEFFELYTETLHDRYIIKPIKPIPAGWSSWSCLYDKVDENAVLYQAGLLSKDFLKIGADLVQIDDGWEKEGLFGAYWTHDEKKFPSDIPGLSKKLTDLGLKLGLWMAPGMVVDHSSRFEELSPLMNRKDGNIFKLFGGNDALPADKNGSVYGLDIAKEEVIELMREMFSRGVNDFKAVYFKIDFIVNLLLRMGVESSRVEYKDGYSVELYRHYMKELRKTVGDEIFLLACGAPIGESVGIFDSIRISSDITWNGADSPWHPGAWNIIRNDAQCAVLRSPFHKKVFINDPDALLVRDYVTDKGSDGMSLTLDEAKMWATVVAMCGGQILINEELDKLSDERKALCANILPPLGLAARPRDFYEYPWCSEAFIDVSDDARLTALYNWGDDEITKTVTNPYDDRAIMVDCWSHQIIGYLDGSCTFDLPAHTCRSMMIKKLPDKCDFLFSDGDFYLGLNGKRGTSYYYDPERDADNRIFKETNF